MDRTQEIGHGGATSLHPTRLQTGLTYYSVLLFAVLWLGLAAALAFGDGWLDSLWSWIRELPVVAEAVVWIAFLPVVAGLGVWEASWSESVRAAAFLGLAAWSTVAFASLRFTGGDD